MKSRFISTMMSLCATAAYAGPSLSFIELGEGSLGTCFSAESLLLGGQLSDSDSSYGLIYGGPDSVRILPSFASGYTTAVVGVSDSGVALGRTGQLTGPDDFAIVWDADGEVINIGDLGGTNPVTGGRLMLGFDISASGNVVVGSGMAPEGIRGFIWSSSSGLTPLPALDLPGDPGVQSTAIGVSDISGNIFGRSVSASGVSRIVGWTPSGQVSDLTPDNTTHSLFPQAASPDGTTLVGIVAETQQLFRWVEGVGLELVAHFPNAASLAVRGSSAGGSVIVGYYAENTMAIDFIWLPDHGVVDFNFYIESVLGIDLGNWRLQPGPVSNDGNLISGIGYYDTGNPDDFRFAAFILDISPSCFVDWNDDGALNYFDIAAFIDAYLAGDPATDVEPNGVLDLHDITTFVGLYLAGCP